jgi:hypothetical protein
MTTAVELITDALGEIGVADAGQALSANDSALGLRVLNRLFQRWSNMRLLQPVLDELSVTMTGAASYTLGPGGSPARARPLKVLSATFVDTGGLESPVQIITREQWDAIPNKADTGSYPDRIWYAAENTDGIVYTYPKCSTGTLKLDVLTNMQALGMSDTLTLPDGYESAIVSTLADDLATHYGMSTPPDVRRRAAGAVRALKRTNHEPILAVQELAFAGQRADIQRGY